MARLTPRSSFGAVLFAQKWRLLFLFPSYAVHGLDRWQGIELRDDQLSGLLALEWRYRPKNSWILQYLVSEGVAETRDPFDENAHEVGVGWKREVSRNTMLVIDLIENAVTADNNPDFVTRLGLKFRF